MVITNNLKEAAYEFGLQTAEITQGLNGYPKELKPVAIGFDSFEAAEEFADHIGGEVVELRQRDGHQFWENRGPVHGPFTPMDILGKHNDDYYIVDGTEKEPTREEAKAIESLKAGQVCLFNNGSHVEDVDQISIHFHVDVYTYTIGVTK